MKNAKNQKKVQDLLKIVQDANVEEFRPVVFWSINGDLQEEELRRQIREMKEFNLGGVIFHARAGLTTEYLSEEWFRLVEVCLQEGKKNGLVMWAYDEFGWPSGFVGGKLLQERENCARYLEYEVLDTFDEEAFAVYALEGGAPRLLRKGEEAKSYHTLYLRYSDAYADILNPQVTEAFIQATHEQYYARLAPYFGKELLGFFTDEPQYYRYATPMSKATEGAWREEYGTDVKEGLLYLFLNEESAYDFRVRYYNLMNRLYCKNFYKKLYDWCENHGCLLTGHSVEESFFFTQMWGGADCATSYLYEHVPAIDNLTRYASASISGKNVGSVAAQTGKSRIMTETFGCSGYATTPRQLRAVGEKQYVHGVNLMCQHLYNYTLAGQGKLDHPLHFGRTLPWASGYGAFNEYFARLGWLIANGREDAPVAVVTPMESVYLDYQRHNEERAREVDCGFALIAAALKKAGIAYHFVNEKVFERLGRVEKKEWIVGDCRYQAVVLANCRTLKAHTARCLREYSKAEGALVVAGEAPAFIEGVRVDLSDIRSNRTIEELPRPEGIKGSTLDYTVRTLPNGKRFVFAVNEGDTPEYISTTKPYCRIDLTAGKGYVANDTFTVPPQTSLLLEEGGEYVEKEWEIGKEYTLAPVFSSSDDNTLTIDEVCVTTETGERLQGYVYGVFETLVKRGYCGKIRVEFPFTSDIVCKVKITVEKQPIEGVYCNGKPLQFTQAKEDVNLLTAETTLAVGENALGYDASFTDGERIRAVLFEDGVPESLRNCFSYFTCMEPVYVQGAFDVYEGRICKAKGKKAGNLTEQGYENFYGCVEYLAELPIAGRVRVQPIGEFAMCECICGEQKATVLLGDSVEMRIPQGEKVCKIRCYSTLRNRFGPFHCADGDEVGISPDKFTLCGGWEDERTNKAYVKKRIFLPFGLEKILVQTEK